MSLLGCSGIIFNNPAYEQTAFTTLSFQQGGIFFSLTDVDAYGPSSGIVINDARVKNAISFFGAASSLSNSFVSSHSGRLNAVVAAANTPAAPAQAA